MEQLVEYPATCSRKERVALTSEGEVLSCGGCENDRLLRSLVGAIFRNGGEVMVEAEADHETGPLEGNVPVGESMVVGHHEVLVPCIVAVDVGVLVTKESHSLESVDNEEFHAIHVVHEVNPSDEEVDGMLVVGHGEHPDEGGGNPGQQTEDDINGLTHAVVGIGVGRCLECFRLVEPVLVVVNLKPIHGAEDGCASVHNPSAILLLIPVLHAGGVLCRFGHLVSSF